MVVDPRRLDAEFGSSFCSSHTENRLELDPRRLAAEFGSSCSSSYTENRLELDSRRFAAELGQSERWRFLRRRVAIIRLVPVSPGLGFF